MIRPGDNRRRLAVLAFAALGALAAPGCGSDEGGGEGSPAASADDPGALSDPGASEASPEAPAALPPDSGEPQPLPEHERAAVSAAVGAYIAALDAHDGARVCRALLPGAVELGELPRRRGGCAPSLDDSIGFRPPGGTPAWKRTTIREVDAVSVGAGRARVTATVSHDFADRRYVSVEEDVIYLQRHGEEWLIAKPSGSFYRAIGFPEPPLRALSPP